jgi:peptidoglycan/LPS O-acetylase OafA/YrhL
MQAPVQKAMIWVEQYVRPEAPLRTGLIVAVYIGVLALSTFLLFRFVEQPARRLLRKRLAAPPSARVRVSASVSSLPSPAPSRG